MYATHPLGDHPHPMPVCGLLCLHELQNRFGEPLLLISAGGAPTVCTHCYVCGQLAQWGEPCVLHFGTDCPEEDWAGTITGGSVVRTIALITGRPATARHLSRAAEIAVIHTQLTPDEVAFRVVEELDGPTGLR